MKTSNPMEEMLIAARIPRTYHVKAMSTANEFPLESDDLLRASTSPDENMVIYGSADRAEHALHMVARSMVVGRAKGGIVVLPLPIIRRIAYGGASDALAEAAMGTDAIAIPTIYDSHWAHPLSEQDFYIMERWLLSQMNNYRRILVSADSPPDKWKWWSPVFRNPMARAAIVKLSK